MTNSIGEALRPCPFCGSDEVSMSYSATMQSPDPAHRFIECEECSACGPVCPVAADDEGAQRAAAGNWNAALSRASQPVDSEAVERVNPITEIIEGVLRYVSPTGPREMTIDPERMVEAVKCALHDWLDDAALTAMKEGDRGA